MSIYFLGIVQLSPNYCETSVMLKFGSGVNILKNNVHDIYICGQTFDYNTSESFIQTEGIFSFVDINKDTKEIVIGADKYGIGSIYYCVEDNNFIFSTSLSLLKNEISNVNIDVESLKQWLFIGDYIGSSCVLHNVHRLSYGQEIHIENSKWAIKQTWDLNEIPNQEQNHDKFLQDNNKHLYSALSKLKNLDNDISIIISGGDDSRRIIAVASDINLNAASFTQKYFGPGGFDEDTEIAHLVSTRLNYKCHVIDAPSDEKLFDNMMLCDHLLNWESYAHYWSYETVKMLPSKSIVIDGIGFDVILNAHYLHQEPRYLSIWNDVDMTAELILKKNNGFLNQNLKINLKNKIIAELSKIPSFPGRINLFALLNHTRRSIGCWHQIFLSLDHNVSAPFFYHALFDHSLHIDVEWASKAYAQFESLKKINFELCNIPSTRRGVPAKFKIDLRNRLKQNINYQVKHTKIHDNAFELCGISKRKLFFWNIKGLGNCRNYYWKIRPLLIVSRILNWAETKICPFTDCNIVNYKDNYHI